MSDWQPVDPARWRGQKLAEGSVGPWAEDFDGAVPLIDFDQPWPQRIVRFGDPEMRAPWFAINHER